MVSNDTGLPSINRRRRSLTTILPLANSSALATSLGAFMQERNSHWLLTLLPLRKTCAVKPLS
ncbi:hypothetical protein D3C75_1351860 [compost metagenome]